ncbi:predicted protein [Uncinocarpus reesii 1704]|uniref:LysM domain-containing protein n=1 Tax=Uncinocarpus reesii (strain UAMH 1704) TaxID=336963 RepID=C4JLB6_UNCRE|nr:uncharacterized protein UREG_03624 [Uncinocarpus reesii 1704]EEP78778.1 predicted protein [Uncinocarpus reesii 1704]
MKFSQLAVASLAAPLAAGYLVDPPGRAAPGTTQQCSKWVVYSAGLTCAKVQSAFGITAAQFTSWNPIVTQISTTCTLLQGYDYCVEINFSGRTSSSAEAPTTDATTAAPPETTAPVPTTTSPGNGIATPTPYQPDMVTNCNSFHLVSDGDSCDTIAAAAGVSLSDFYSWNPAVGNTCTTLWLGYYVCTGVIGATPTPPSTTTSPGNGIETPTPIQPGMNSNCNSFHLVADGDDCDAISRAAGIALQDFYAWNPAVGNTCSSLWLGYYVCTGIIGSSPTTMPPSTTTKPGNGIATPTPTQANMTPNCNKFHLVVSGDNCYDIAKNAGVPLDSFYTWNPSVGNTCSSLWSGYYVCVGVIGGTPTTMRTTTTTKPGNGVATPTPTQAGMINRCDTFHRVVSGDNCYDIAQKAKISLSNFYAWNPAVGNTCSSLWAGYYVCIGLL